MRRVHVVRAAFAALAAFVLLAAVVQISGLATAVGSVCVEQCEDGDEAGRCAPSCDDCACCVSVRTVLTAGRTLQRPVEWPARRRVLHVEQPADPDPAEIDHVPIAA
jgi:hypothetical protein